MEKSPINPNPLDRVLRCLHRLASFLPLDAPDYMSDHYDPLASPVEPVTALTFPKQPHHTQDDFVLNRDEQELGWDDMGTYFQQ